jgi:hypothetical protein
MAHMNIKEPYYLTEWVPRAVAHQKGRLFTCGRPGRGTLGTRRQRVDDERLNRWMESLLRQGTVHIVSLLGSKKDGYSEFGYYPFRSAMEPGTKPTFQEWLTERYGSRFVVHEFPTVDARPVQPHVLEGTVSCVVSLLEKGSTVVVVDSAGSERTARVCEKIATKKQASNPMSRPT